LGCQWSKSVKG